MMDNNQITELVIRAKNKDEAACEELFNACYNDVYYFALKTVNDSEIAADVTQESFLEIYRTLDKLEEPKAFAVWMRQITFHQCARHYRKKDEILVDENEEGETIFDDIVDESKESAPPEFIEDEEVNAFVHETVNSLSEEQRSAVMMYYFDELSVEQIAKVQGVSAGTVKSRLNYARKSLRKKVEEYEKKSDIKLHVIPFWPLFLLFFRDFKEASEKAVPPFGGALSQAAGGGAGAGYAVSSAAGMPLHLKIISAGVALVLAGGIGYGVSKLILRKKPDNKSLTEPEITSVLSEAPTDQITEAPTEVPAEEHTEAPTEEPTEAPTEEPTEEPTEAPAEEPTEAPTAEIHVHSYEIVYTYPASCTEDGYSIYRCECGDEYQGDLISAAGHSYGLWAVSKAVTCDADGSEVRKCSECGASQSRAVPSTGHVWIEGEVIHNDSNCADEQDLECSLCGKKCRRILSWSHSFKNASNQYVQQEECIYCHMRVINYYSQFENLFSSQDENAALYTDSVHLTQLPQTVRSDWSPLWKDFESAVRRSSGIYSSSGRSEEYSLSGLKVYPGMSEEDYHDEYLKFCKAFRELYGWTPADAEFYDNEYEIFMESDARSMYNAFVNGVSGMSAEEKNRITDTLIQELIYESGIYDGMQLYNAVGLLYDTIAENVLYDWTLSYHSAFYGLCGGACVCDGYSEIFQRCCDYAGIPCKTIIGTNRGSGHAWNMVTFSDGTERFVDVTINSGDYRILFPKDFINEYKY